MFTSDKNFQPDWANTTVAHNLKEIKKLKQQEGKNIVAWGGAIFAGNLMDAGLVDEIRLGVNPVILGEGKSLFNNFHHRRKLRLIQATEFKSGLILSRYNVEN